MSDTTGELGRNVADLERISPSMQSCLFCGYRLAGQSAGTRCPECGNRNQIERQRALCVGLVSKPIRLVIRFFRLGKLPFGWWEVFGGLKWDPYPTRLVLKTLAIALGVLWTMDCIVGTVIRFDTCARTSYYDSTGVAVQTIRTVHVWTGLNGILQDSEILTPIQEAVRPDWTVGTVTTRHMDMALNQLSLWYACRWCIFVSCFVIINWTLMRYCWLYYIRSPSTQLEAADIVGIGRGGDSLSAIPIAHVIWYVVTQMIATGVVQLTLCDANLIVAYKYAAIPPRVVLLVYPLIIWWRSIAADHSGRLFGHRVIAFATLIGLNCVALGMSVGVFAVVLALIQA